MAAITLSVTVFMLWSFTRKLVYYYSTKFAVESGSAALRRFQLQT